MFENHFAIIMAGGIGSRFWPSSTPDFPKQFHDMTGSGRSLLQSTFERLENFIPSNNIYIVTQNRYQSLIISQLGDKILPSQVICEPDRRNTAPCILMASLKIHKMNADAKIVVTPSDHLVEDEKLFREDIELALEAADSKNLITFGIQPNFPATGFGYVAVNDNDVQSRLKPVLEFTEKPDLETAQKFIDAQNYFWNSGIFVWSAKAVLDGFKIHAPSLYNLFFQAYEHLNTAAESAFIDKNYPLAQNISIDYALMEKSDNIYLIPARFDWNDLGSWKSIYDRLPKDDQNNVVVNGAVYAEKSHGNLVRIDSKKKVVISGLENFIIVDTEKVLMICPMDKNQQVNDLSKNASKKLENKKD